MNKKIIAMTLTAAAMASLCACGPQIPDLTEKTAATTAKTADDGSSQTSADEKANIELTVQDSSVHMPDIGNFRVNAAYHGSSETKIDTITTKPLEFDSQALTSAFFGDKKYSEQVSDKTTFYKVADAELDYDAGYIYGSSLTYFTEKGMALDTLFAFTDYPLNPGELTFMKPDEAKAIVSDKLKALDLDIPEKIRIQSLSHEDLQNIRDNFDKYKIDLTAPLIPYFENYSFSGADDIYILSWTSTLNGIDSAMGMRYAIISSNGLEFMSMHNLLTTDQTVEVEDNSIISVEDAVRAVFDAYKEEKNDQLFTVNDITLGYMIGGSNSFSPVWFFSGTIGEDEFRWGADAYTGEVSKYDMTPSAGQNILSRL